MLPPFVYFITFALSLPALASEPANQINQESCFEVGRKVGLQSYGALTEDAILKLLKTGPIKKIEILEVGDSKPLKVSLGNSIHGVFKAKTLLDNPSHEVAAYKIDRLLGLDLVPPTILREFEGKTGSLQFFVEGGRSPYETLSYASRNLRFFDLVIANTDRSGDNFLVLPNGSQVAIDNMRAFKTVSASLPHEWVVRQAIPDRAVYDNYKALDAKQWHQSLDSLLGKKTVNKLIQRRELFVKQVEQWVAAEGADTVFSSEKKQ